MKSRRDTCETSRIATMQRETRVVTRDVNIGESRRENETITDRDAKHKKRSKSQRDTREKTGNRDEKHEKQRTAVHRDEKHESDRKLSL